MASSQTVRTQPRTGRGEKEREVFAQDKSNVGRKNCKKKRYRGTLVGGQPSPKQERRETEQKETENKAISGSEKNRRGLWTSVGEGPRARCSKRLLLGKEGGFPTAGDKKDAGWGGPKKGVKTSEEASRGKKN